MKNVMSISANLDQPSMLRNVVEKLASRHVDMGYSRAIVPQQWKAIESSCVQADVMGSIDMQAKEQEVNIPFTGSFLFTCVKASNTAFNLEWCASLS